MQRKTSFQSWLRVVGIISLILAAAGWLFLDRSIATAISLLLGISAFVASLWALEKPINQYILTSQYLHFRKRILQKIERVWIDNVLKANVGYDHLINLRYGFSRQGEEKEAHDHSLKHLLADFESSDGSLLVLGRSGSGKTFCLLSLCDSLLRNAKKNQDYPIPVVLKLSSWTTKRSSIADWLTGELDTLYGIPGYVAKEWIEHNLLTLLLDGLDEIEKEHQHHCIDEINSFREVYRMTDIVVCYRLEDFRNQNKNLHLSCSVELESLDLNQISSYLSALGTKGKRTLRLLQQDPRLTDFVNTPLSLTLIYAISDKVISELKSSDDDQKKQKTIIAAYVAYGIDQIEETAVKKQQLLARLSWLGKMMTEHNQPTLSINSLQPNWIKAPRERFLYLFGTDSVSSILIGFFTGPLLLLFFTVNTKYTYATEEHYRLAYYLNALLLSLHSHAYQNILPLIFLSLGALLLFMGEGFMYTGVLILMGGITARFSSFADPVDQKKAANISKKIPGLARLVERLRNTRFIANLRKISYQRIDVANDPFMGIGIRFFASVDLSLQKILIGLFVGVVLFVLFILFQMIGVGLRSHQWGIYQLPIFTDARFLIYYLTASIGLGVLTTISLHNIFPQLEALAPSKSRYSFLFSRRLFLVLNQSFLLGACSGIIGGTVIGYLSSFFIDTVSAIVLGIVAALSLGFWCFWFLGGMAAVRHMVLRTIFAFRGFIPWDYEKMLETIAKTSIIIDTGDGFIFAHPLIQEYLQGLNLTTSA